MALLMIKNYIRTSWRNLRKQPGFTTINLAGLILGISACTLLALYVWEDLSFNKFNSKFERIARVLTIDKSTGISSQYVGVSYPAIGPALVEDMPEVIESARIMESNINAFRYDNEFYHIDGIYITENSLFKIFDFELIEGTYDEVLTQPSTVVITQSYANLVFGDKSALGETISNQVGTEYEIVGVMEDPPKSSHFEFDVLQAMVPTPDNQGFINFLQAWNRISVQTYVLLNEPIEVADYDETLYEFAMERGGYEAFYPVFQNLADVHLNSSDVLFEINNRKSDINNVYIMSAIGLLILILACFNFVNLMIAQSVKRSKEIGIRKVSGGTRPQLIVQHLSESTFQVALAFILSIVIVYISVPVFNDLYGRNVDLSWLFNPAFVLICILSVLIVGLLSGFYPSMVLSSFNTTAVLKGNFNTGSQGIMLRNGLVIFQFIITVALISSTFVVYQQMNFIFESDLGYNRDQIISMRTGQAQDRNIQFTLYEELERIPGVKAVAASSQQIGAGYGRSAVVPEGYSSEDNVIVNVTSINEHYLDAMQIDLAEGRNFSEAFSDSGRSVLVNEAFLETLGWDVGIGKTVTFGATTDSPVEMEVVGVVSDFHYTTIRHKVEPIILFYNRALPVISVKVEKANLQATIEGIQSTWQELIPSVPFEYSFLDDSFAQLYESERTLSKIIAHFSVLALSIALIGLFMLSVFTVQQRRKEIGIRKVLGSTTQSISVLLGRDFLKWIFISNIIGLPISWYLLKEWLSNFEYRTELGITPFFGALLLSLLVAILTISIHTLRAASENPIKALRIE